MNKNGAGKTRPSKHVGRLCGDLNCIGDRTPDDDDHVLWEYRACGVDRQDAAREIFVPVRLVL